MFLPTNRRSTRTLIAVGAIAALTLAVAGCSDEGGGDESAEEGELSYDDSPLSQLLGDDSFAGMSEEEQMEYYTELDRKIEEKVAACMAEQGFDYQPVESTLNFGMPGESEDLSAEEYAEQYGYGYTTTEVEETDDENQDPNAETYDSMSESERMAWDTALYGDMSSFDENTDFNDIDLSQMGCYGAAQDEVTSQDSELSGLMAVYEDPAYADLLQQMTEIYTDADESPEMAALNQEWSDCMAEAGYPDLATPNDAWDYVASLTEGAWDEESNGYSEEVQAEEIAVATADYTCKSDMDYNNKQMRLYFDAEQDFIDNNQAAVDSLVEAMNQAGESE